MAKHFEVIVRRDGAVEYIYDEVVDLSQLGTKRIRRASHVEPDVAGQWWADMSPVQPGVRLGLFGLRSQALAAEAAWLQDWLTRNTINNLAKGTGVS